MYKNAELSSNVQGEKVNSCHNIMIEVIQHQPLIMVEEKLVNYFLAFCSPKSHIRCEYHPKLHQHWQLTQSNKRETASAEDPTCTQILNQLQAGSVD